MIANPADRSRSIPRLPWTATGAALAAMAALYMRESGSLALPFLALALVASYFVNLRIDDSTPQPWAARFVLFGLVVAANLARSADEATGLVDPRSLNAFGELCAAELVVQAWRQRPSGGGRGVATILLSGLILLAASNTFDESTIRYFVPAYFLFLIPALREFRSTADGVAPRIVSKGSRTLYAVTVLLALAGGEGTHLLIISHHDALVTWGMKLLRETPEGEQTSGLSTSPRLGPSYGLAGSDEQVMHVEGDADVSHLRGVTFDMYVRGQWLPSGSGRQLSPVNPQDMDPRAAGRPLRVTRLIGNESIVFAPLSAAGIALPDGGTLEWAKEYGSPLCMNSSTPSTYLVIASSDPDHQGPLCQPLDPTHRKRLLEVPLNIDPRVRDLALRLAGGIKEPRERVRAIQDYLLTSYGYSLDYRPEPGDPVSHFILDRRPAHCEYFAAAASILLRYVGVPTRYVIGYYGHERDGAGGTIVRQHDAHAWAESWIDGRGWITVDATPSDGRPDHTARSLALITRLREWLQPRLSALRAHPGKVVLLAAVVALLWGTVSFLRRPPRRTAGPPPLSYRRPDAELAALGARFEALCRRNGLTLPPGRTWQEVLSAQRGQEPEGTALDIEGALSFVRSYNAVRFGGPARPESLDELRGLLRLIDSNAARAGDRR